MQEHFHEGLLRVRVPRGNEGFWQIICRLAADQETFTVADIDGESNVNAQLIRKYIRLLIAGGFVERVGTKPKSSAKNFATPVYRLLKFQRQAPRVRPDGSLISGTAIEALWTSIRGLQTFSLRELVFAATTPDVKPKYDNAKLYVRRLTDAGYLSVVPGTVQRTWRLKPGMNTGPQPPVQREVRAKVMWDPNRKGFVGSPPIASEAAT